jgi:hypothetical protein
MSALGLVLQRLRPLGVVVIFQLTSYEIHLEFHVLLRGRHSEVLTALEQFVELHFAEA